MKRKKIIILICAVIFLILIFMLSPVFKIQNVEINDLKYLSPSSVMTDIGLEGEKGNIFIFSKSKAKKILEANSYVESADIKMKLPNTLVVDITERVVTGYVPYMNKYLYIDFEGRVLDVRGEMKENLPVILGLEFENFTLDKILEVENKESFDTLIELSKLVKKYNLSENVFKLDVSDVKDIRMYVKNVQVIFGDFSNAGKKLATLSEISKTFTDDNVGFLDISDMEKTPFFTPLY